MRSSSSPRVFPSPSVRASAYRALGVWGDADATDAIEGAATAEPDARAQVAAAETLVANRGPDAPRSPAVAPVETRVAATDAGDLAADETGDVPPFEVAWAWATEHARFDRLARDISRDRDRLHEAVRG